MSTQHATLLRNTMVSRDNNPHDVTPGAIRQVVLRPCCGLEADQSIKCAFRRSKQHLACVSDAGDLQGEKMLRLHVVLLTAVCCSGLLALEPLNYCVYVSLSTTQCSNGVAG
jgi:hypothetical protein